MSLFQQMQISLFFYQKGFCTFLPLFYPWFSIIPMRKVSNLSTAQIISSLIKLVNHELTSVIVDACIFSIWTTSQTVDLLIYYGYSICWLIFIHTFYIIRSKYQKICLTERSTWQKVQNQNVLEISNISIKNFIVNHIFMYSWPKYYLDVALRKG